MKSALLIGVVSPAAIRENDVEKNILNAETDFTWDLQNVIAYQKSSLKLHIYNFFRIVVLDPPISSTRAPQGELKRINTYSFIIIKSINLNQFGHKRCRHRLLADMYIFK